MNFFASLYISVHYRKIFETSTTILVCMSLLFKMFVNYFEGLLQDLGD